MLAPSPVHRTDTSARSREVAYAVRLPRYHSGPVVRPLLHPASNCPKDSEVVRPRPCGPGPAALALRPWPCGPGGSGGDAHPPTAPSGPKSSVVSVQPGGSCGDDRVSQCLHCQCRPSDGDGRNDDWDVWLPCAVFAINNAALTLGGCITPSFIDRGQRPPLPLPLPDLRSAGESPSAYGVCIVALEQRCCMLTNRTARRRWSLDPVGWTRTSRWATRCCSGRGAA